MPAALASLLAAWALLVLPRASGLSAGGGAAKLKKGGSGELGLEQATAYQEQRGDSRYHIAWLISGQVSRFIYKDGTSLLSDHLSGFVGCQSRANCGATLDVHIALANTHAGQFTGPKYQLPSYEDGAFEEAALQNHYKNLKVAIKASMAAKVKELKSAWTGVANNVLVTIKSDEQFENEIAPLRKRILKQAAADKNMTEGDWEHNFFRKILWHKMRFLKTGNMMYLRHLAYSSALRFEETLPYKFTHMMYTREDNVFVYPPYTLVQLAKQLDGPSAERPAAVMVDSHCGFESLSDKIYFATRSGFDVLFPRTADDHVRMLANWINRSPKSNRKNDPMQSEEFFYFLLQDAQVEVTTYDFSRTEARYITDRLTNETKLCIPALYYKCTKNAAFEKCPS